MIYDVRMINKETLEKESATLLVCPFCGGKAVFATNKSEQILIQHFPDAGVTCPARYDQYCDSFDQGRLFWNKRA
jgi:hypothetical protein